MTIKDDFDKYPCYVLRHRKLIKLKSPPEHWGFPYQVHHFIKQNVKKTDKEFYKRVEHLQKLILMPSNMHYNLHTMGEVSFFKKYGLNKNLLLFSRLKWREGFYD